MSNKLTINIASFGGIAATDPGSFSLDLADEKGTKHANLIYSPNGTGKSSLARALYHHCKNSINETEHAHIGITTTPIVELKGIDKDNIYVSSLNIDNEQPIAPFITADKETRVRHALLWGKLCTFLDDFLESIKYPYGSREKTLSGLASDFPDFSSDIEITMKNLAREELYKEIADSQYMDEQITYKSISGIDGFVEKNHTKIEKFQAAFDKFAQASKFFDLRNNFLIQNADTSFDTAMKQNYIKAGHKMIFMPKGEEDVTKGTTVGSREEMDDLISKEISEFIEDFGSIPEYKEIEKQLSNKHPELLRLIRDPKVFPQILKYLSDPKILRQSYWLSKCKSNITKLDEYRKYYLENIDEINLLREEADSQKTDWHAIVRLFNDRFHNYPVTLKIENLHKSLFELGDHRIVYEYNTKPPAPKEKISFKRDELRTSNYLSAGEIKIFETLDLVYAIEHVKKKYKNSELGDYLFVIDDLVDSFDYKNKYAFIRYLVEAESIPNLHLLVLSHNFDFFRTLCHKFNKANRYQMYRNDKGVISLIENQPPKTIRESLRRGMASSNSLKKRTSWLALVPIARSLTEYQRECEDTGCTKHPSCSVYNQLSESLHCYANHSCAVTNEIFKGLKLFDNSCPFGEEIIVTEAFLQVAKSLAKQDKMLLLEKMVLATATRIIAEQCLEKYIKKYLGEDEIGKIRSKQLNYFDLLLEAFMSIPEDKQDKRTLPDGESLEFSRVASDVSIISPEHIHINSFMYEPLVDVDASDLCEAYNNIVLFR